MTPISDPEMFIRLRGITRCPTACAVKTTGTVSVADRAKLADYHAAQEAKRAADEAANAGLAH